MRNIFDQYSQPENQLTHALACGLSEDKLLLRAFVQWVTSKKAPASATLKIVEQQVPGDVEISDEDSGKRGLPDAWIHDDGKWSLLIESKISARLDNEQLRRHYRTAVRRGFEDITLLAIAVDRPRHSLPDGMKFKKWSEVYRWLVNATERSKWARRIKDYMEIAEAKMSEKGYLQEGTLTTFSGIPFGEDSPYNYPEARRVLKLAIEQLRNRNDLVRTLGINGKLPGRGAIMGRHDSGVWDFLRLSDSENSELHTLFPHFTLAIGQDRTICIVTIPHGIKAEFRKNVVNLRIDGFTALMSEVNKGILSGVRKASGSAPWVEVLQRRYPSQRAAAIVDASLAFDLRTAFPGKGKLPVKGQSEWLEATYDALARKRSNLQVAVGAVFPYRTCEATRNPQILDSIAATWIACKPLVDALVKGRY